MMGPLEEGSGTHRAVLDFGEHVLGVEELAVGTFVLLAKNEEDNMKECKHVTMQAHQDNSIRLDAWPDLVCAPAFAPEYQHSVYDSKGINAIENYQGAANGKKILNDPPLLRALCLWSNRKTSR